MLFTSSWLCRRDWCDAYTLYMLYCFTCPVQSAGRKPLSRKGADKQNSKSIVSSGMQQKCDGNPE